MAVKPNKVAMVLLVKNEIDIIDLNLRFHRAKGINQFIVMDNGSTDGTLDYLRDQAERSDLVVIDNPDSSYQQSKWMTAMARQARDVFGVSHVIPNDADEFWWPKDGLSIPEVLSEDATVQTVQRYNRLLTREMESAQLPFYQAEYFVKSPILYSGESQINDPSCSMQLVKISPKVIVQPRLLWKIKGGNHRARHLKFWSKYNNSDLQVHHFPYRTYSQFETNIAGRAEKLGRPKVKMGPHIKRWVPMYNNGTLEQEYNHLLISDAQRTVLSEIGVIGQEKGLPAFLADLMEPKP